METTTYYDALIEICCWLPAKVIHKFKSVDKIFAKFLKEAYFCKRQAENALIKDDSCFFIQPNITQTCINGITELHPLPGEEISSGISSQVVKFLANNSIKILGSSNGLILGRASNWKNVEDLFIINPATQCWLRIPTPKHIESVFHTPKLDIVFKCDSDNFMVILFYHNLDWPSLERHCQVYIEKEGEWKERQTNFFHGQGELKFDMPVFHNGGVHFISDFSPYLDQANPFFWPYIVSYIVDSGVSRMLTVPKEARRYSNESCDLRIFNFGKVSSINQSICLVRLKQLVFTVWILIDYQRWLWKRIVKLKVTGKRIMEESPIVIQGFTVLNGDLLVFATNKKVYSYDLGREMCSRPINTICEHGCDTPICFTSYQNTLRTCGADGRLLIM